MSNTYPIDNTTPVAPHASEFLPTPADRDAIDALVNEAMCADRVEPSLRPRAAGVSRLLGMLGAVRVREDRLLVDIAMARALRAQPDAPGREPCLVPADEEALDAWMLAGYDSARVPSSLRDRAQKHERIARLLATPTTANASNLVERTLFAVDRAEAAKSDRFRVAPERARRGLRVRINDLVSVAAMLLIGAAVAIPILANTRAYARQTLCQANLGSTAVALASYAAANRDSLPVSTAGLGSGTWWNVGSTSSPSNSANLFTLYRNGYVGLQDLACPGNPQATIDPSQTSGFDWRRLEQVSYSYQIIPNSGIPTIHENPSRVVLADRSPVILLAIRGQPIDPHAKSPNHAERGQHILRGDGSTEWLRSPVLESTGDNIWLPLAIENRIRQLQGHSRGSSGSAKVDPIKGNERPATPDDVFLGP
jgi:hypothetical protein